MAKKQISLKIVIDRCWWYATRIAAIRYFGCKVTNKQFILFCEKKNQLKLLLARQLINQSSQTLSELASSSGVNIINILWAEFTCTDHKSAKKTDSLTVFFALMGSAHIKAAHRMLINLTPWINFTNIFTCSFFTPIPKVQKDRQVVSVFLRLWDLHT